MKIERIKVKQLFGLKCNDYDIQCYPKAYTTIIFSLNGCGKTSLMRLIDAALTRKYTILDGILFRKLELVFDNGESLIVSRIPGRNEELKRFDNTKISELPKDEKGWYYMPITYAWQCKDGKTFEGRFYISKETSERIANEVKENPDIHFFSEDSLKKTKRQVFLSEFYHEWYTDTEKGLGKSEKSYTDADSDSILGKLSQITSNIILANRDYNRIGAGQIMRHKQQISNPFEIYDLNQLRFEFKDIEEIKKDKVIAYYTAAETSETEFIEGKLPSENPSPTDSFYYISIPEKTDEICGEIQKQLKEGKDSDSLKEYISLLNDVFGFTDKFIELDMDKGLVAQFDSSFPDAPDLNISQLSAGEKSLITLFYELLFKIKANGSVVLIDEPEASLHVDWQRALVRNIRRICEERDIQALITTHSPSVINDNFLLMSEMGRKEA